MAALGEPTPKSYDDIHFYSRVADLVRALSVKHSLDLRTIDRALWTWDKLRSRTLSEDVETLEPNMNSNGTGRHCCNR